MALKISPKSWHYRLIQRYDSHHSPRRQYTLCSYMTEVMWAFGMCWCWMFAGVFLGLAPAITLAWIAAMLSVGQYLSPTEDTAFAAIVCNIVIVTVSAYWVKGWVDTWRYNRRIRHICQGYARHCKASITVATSTNATSTMTLFLNWWDGFKNNFCVQVEIAHDE